MYIRTLALSTAVFTQQRRDWASGHLTVFEGRVTLGSSIDLMTALVHPDTAMGNFALGVSNDTCPRLGSGVSPCNLSICKNIPPPIMPS